LTTTTPGADLALIRPWLSQNCNAVRRAEMELRRGNRVTVHHGNESSQNCGVYDRDQKSPYGHVVRSPRSKPTPEVDHSPYHVTKNAADDDVIAGQPISDRCGDDTLFQECVCVLFTTSNRGKTPGNRSERSGHVLKQAQTTSPIKLF